VLAGLIGVASVALGSGQPGTSPGAPPAAMEIPEIVVTGERVSRSLRETSSSVYVATESDMEAQGADRVEQVLALIPNVQLGNGSQGPAIRGQDTTGALQALPAFLGGNRPRTTLIVDGRPVTYNEFVFGVAPVWDVARLEVFRSPQTTTQGQNSIAGAIFVNTRDPSPQPEYRARAIVGDFQTRQLSALASGPVAGEAVAFRVAGDLRYSHTTSRIFDWVENADPNHDVFGVLRAKLLVKPPSLPGSRMTLTYTHLHSQAPQLVGLTAPFRRRRDVEGGYGVFRINVDSLTAAIRHEAGSDLTANLLLTAGDGKVRRLAPAGLGQTRIDGRDWSAEAVLHWFPEGPLRIVGGISHTHVALRQFIDLSLLSGLGRFRDNQDGSGLFGEATLALSPRATVTAGMRYQRDRQKRRGALDAGPSDIADDFDGNFHAWLPKLSFAYDFTPAVRVGVMVQRAYNPGGTTIRFDTGAPDNFDAETLWDYELFARAGRPGGRLTATANLFYYDMRDSQRAEPIRILTPSGIPVGFADLFNVPRARSYGLEAGVEWRAGNRFSARLALGLLDTRITDAGQVNTLFQDKQFARAPHLSGSAAVDWQPMDRLRLAAQLRHHSPYFSDNRNLALHRVPSGTIVDARLQYAVGRLSLFAQVRNLFDGLGLTELSDNGFSATAEDPRQVSVGIDSRF
jgi:outer membrane receptor protein involved in Fe transport